MQDAQVVIVGHRQHVVERGPRAGASTSFLPAMIAADWASQVGYQNERISRFAW